MIGRRLARFRASAVAHGVIGLLSLPCVLIFGLPFGPLLIGASIWLVVLGCLVWRRGDEVAAALRRTHVVVLVIAAILCAYGLFALQAAERSAVRGGGPLGAFGWLPLAFGVVLGVIVSLWLGRDVGSRWW